MWRGVILLATGRQRLGGYRSNAEWPEATPEVLGELGETSPKLVRAFHSAVERGATPTRDSQ